MSAQTIVSPVVYQLAFSVTEQYDGAVISTSAEYLRQPSKGCADDRHPLSVRIEGQEIHPDLLAQGDYEIIIRRVL